MTQDPTDVVDTKSGHHRHPRNAIASILTVSALLFAAYSVMAMSSPTSSFPSGAVQAAYAQDQQQGQSDVADKATRMSAAVDGTLRFYAKAIGAQYRETDVSPIPGAENINAIDDVSIPSVPLGSEGNTTGIVSMADYLVSVGLLDKSYELFVETARLMRNVTFEDVNELQVSLLQMNTLIQNRAPYNLVEDVVMNLQGHLQNTLANTQQFNSATAGTTTSPSTTTSGGAGAATDTSAAISGGANNATSAANSSTTVGTTAGATTTDTGTTNNTADATTSPSPLLG